MLLHWLIHLTGADNPTGSIEAFWAGFGSDLTELIIIVGLIKWLRHKNCHVKGCLRFGHHEVEGTPYKTCHKHATVPMHRALHLHHKNAHPDQHRLFKGR